MTTPLKFSGWNRDYVMSPQAVDKYTDTVLSVLYDTYTSDNGSTTFQGQSFSHVVATLRDRRLVVPGVWGDQKALFEALGFTITRARGRRIYRGGKEGWGVECDCITL